VIPIRLIREQPERVRQALADRRDAPLLDQVLAADDRRRALLQEIEGLRAERNTASKAIGGTSDAGARQVMIERTRALSGHLDALEPQLAAADAELEGLLLLVPNLPHASVSAGTGPADNAMVRTHGTPRDDPAARRPHWEIGEQLGILDFPRAAKVAGSGFWVFKGAGARLQRALIAWMLDLHVARHGYREVYPPALVTELAMTNAGKLPKFADDSYRAAPDSLWLNPTAEVPLTMLHTGETLDAALLPVKYTGYTPAFRREAGAAGTDTRGLRRVHQFDKVELVNFSDPAVSYDDLESMLGAAEETVALLGLPYRILSLCTADLGFASSKTYDIEVWAPGVNDWLEVSSVSNCEAFQARRAGIRFRRAGSAHSDYVHTLNGSGLALPRTVIAILENFQASDGTVTLPEVLRAYMGGSAQLSPEAAWP